MTSMSQDLNPIEKKIVDAFLPEIAKVEMDGRGRRKWQGAPDIAGKLACAVIMAGDQIDVTRLALALGMNRSAITQFTHGRNLSAAKWPALLGVMQREGIAPRKSKKQPRTKARVADPPAVQPTTTAIDREKEIEALYDALPKMRYGNDRVMPQWKQHPEIAAKIAAHLIAMGPDAYATARTLKRKINLNPSTAWNLTRGNAPDMRPWPELRAALTAAKVQWYVVAEENAAASPPPKSKTDAAPQQQVNSHAARNWRIVDGDDIEVLQVVRLKYGTPEHREKMREIMLDLGKQRPAATT